MTETLTYTGALVVTTCWCGIRHAIPSELMRQSNNNSRFVVYCPLGHEWVTSKSDSTIEREKRERAEAETARVRARLDQARAELAHTERRRRAAQGQVTKIKNRVGKGVCPCCNRHFANVERHMASQHPTFTEPDAAQPASL